jgi:hypothetical protein
MDISGDGYRVSYDPASVLVSFQGTLRLRGMDEYAPITQLLNDLVDKRSNKITLDLCDLRFLNSSGINVLMRFIINMRDQGQSQVVVYGSSQIPWQGKSLNNLQRLMPELRLEFK